MPFTHPLLLTRQNTLVLKVGGEMFKTRLTYSVMVIIAGYSNFIQLLKSFTSNVQNYKASLNLIYVYALLVFLVPSHMIFQNASNCIEVITVF